MKAANNSIPVFMFLLTALSRDGGLSGGIPRSARQLKPKAVHAN
jgi:hypothetical protein